MEQKQGYVGTNKILGFESEQSHSKDSLRIRESKLEDTSRVFIKGSGG